MRSKRAGSKMSEAAPIISNATTNICGLKNRNVSTKKTPESDLDGPVVIIQDFVAGGNQGCKKTSTAIQDNATRQKVLRPDSSKLLDEMLYPMSSDEFLKKHFKKNAVCIQRQHESPPNKKSKQCNSDADSIDSYGNSDLISLLCHKYLFDLDVRQIFAETSSENVFLWLSPPSDASPHDSLNSVEISDSDTAYALHQSGSHPAYCRAPPLLEQLLVGSLLRSTGLGGGHYLPPHRDTLTLGGTTTLGRGEVELFIGASNQYKKQTNDKDSTKKHTTGAHTDFQENFTIQLSGVKRWTLRRGRVRHPLRATTPHYCREASVVENQLKVARLCCMVGDAAAAVQGNYGFVYNDHNAYGPEQTITLYPGDVLYFPSGMWHTVETIEPGVSLNVSLMGTTYAALVCDALQHLLVSDERWREVVTSRSYTNAVNHLQELMNGLPRTVAEFVSNGGGAQSVLPPALCYPLEERSSDNDAHKCDGELDSMHGEDESMMGSVQEVYIESDDEDAETATSVLVDMDNFLGPSGWSCVRPEDGKLIRNPLALLIAKECITTHISVQNSTKKEYILNVNFAGNEMFESHIRVTLMTEQYINLMDKYAKQDHADADDQVPPECLFFYGLFSWGK